MVSQHFRVGAEWYLRKLVLCCLRALCTPQSNDNGVKTNPKVSLTLSYVIPGRVKYINKKSHGEQKKRPSCDISQQKKKNLYEGTTII